MRMEQDIDGEGTEELDGMKREREILGRRGG